MKIIFNKENLLSVLGPAVAMAPGHSMSGAAEGVLFDCSDGECGLCRITSYDMEKGVCSEIPAKVTGNGKFALNKQRILQIVRLMPDGELTFEVDPAVKVTISSELSSYRIHGIDGSDFPGLPSLYGDKNFTVSSHKLRRIFAGSVIYTNPNEARPAYTGVLITVKNGIMTAAGCDGSRMAIIEDTIDGTAPDCDAIIPVRFLSEFLKVLRDNSDSVAVSLGRKHIIFRIGGLVYFTRLISAEYPDYSKTLPREYATVMFIRTDGLRAALERAAVISEEKLGGFTRGIRLESEDGFVRITAVSSSGSIDERIPAEVRGEGGFVILSCRYLLETLRVLPDVNAVMIGMNDHMSIVCMEEATDKVVCGDDRMSFAYYLMPRRR